MDVMVTLQNIRIICHGCKGIVNLRICTDDQGRTLGGVWGGAKPPLASECHQKSVPFFFDTVLKLGPKIRVQELIFTSVSEFGPTTQELGQVYFFILSIFPYRPRFNPLPGRYGNKKITTTVNSVATLIQQNTFYFANMKYYTAYTLYFISCPQFVEI